MMIFNHLDLIFPGEYLKATLLISLLTVWVLVGLFYYLNRYTQREYFAIWTAGWLFYALWLTASLTMGDVPLSSLAFTLMQSCVSLSAVFMLWGSLRFAGAPVRQTLFGMFMLFLFVWTIVSPQVIASKLQIQLPVFVLLGSSSLFAGLCFLRLSKEKPFAGAGMLSLGFSLWGIYLGTYPLTLRYDNLYSAGFFISAILQLFIAVSMIVLVLEEVRENHVQKERVSAISQMAVNLAHDVNNALSPITGYSELLMGTMELKKESQQYLKKINQAAENVAQIVARMRNSAVPPSSQIPPGAPAIALEGDTERVPAPKFESAKICRPLRILYIDDEPMLRQLISNVLQIHNHKVTVAASGQEGIDLFRSTLKANEPYEVVITDLGMPEMDGRDVARTLRAESPQTPILMLTGWGEIMKATGQTVPEVDAVINKPPHLEELNECLLRVAAARN